MLSDESFLSLPEILKIGPCRTFVRFVKVSCKINKDIFYVFMVVGIRAVRLVPKYFADPGILGLKIVNSTIPGSALLF